MQDLFDYISGAPAGASPADLERLLGLSRSTLGRRLKRLIAQGLVVTKGKGPSLRYCSADPLAPTLAYFAKPHTERKLARYHEERLEPSPGLSAEALAAVPRDRLLLGRRELTQFLIDFSCASSVLEGGTYTFLDTQALLEYGEKAKGKPLGDAFLVLNHKEAFEFLHDHPDLGSIFKVQDLLTNDHDLPELADAPHFLAKQHRGVAREFEDVNIVSSPYLPPFRPGTGYVGKMLDRILELAGGIDDPIQAAFYLLTRLPYLQPFKDGNKRTSRAMCNVPLLRAGLPPISFVDFGTQEYIVSMLAFYELGDLRLAERGFLAAYRKSIARLRPARG